MECDELRTRVARHKPTKRISDTFSKNLERENEHLQLTINEMQAGLDDATSQACSRQNVIEELSEKLKCLEDNLESKKIEIEEKNDAMESAQEKIQELTIEIAMLQSAPEDASE